MDEKMQLETRVSLFNSIIEALVVIVENSSFDSISFDHRHIDPGKATALTTQDSCPSTQTPFISLINITANTC